MQSTQPAPVSPYADCYLQIRRGKQTIFTDVTEATTVSELKQLLAHLLHIQPEIIRLTAKGQCLDTDSEHLLGYGVTSKRARPQNPFPLEFLLQLDDGSYETEQIVPYSSSPHSKDDVDQPPIDTR